MPAIVFIHLDGARIFARSVLETNNVIVFRSVALLATRLSSHAAMCMCSWYRAEAHCTGSLHGDTWSLCTTTLHAHTVQKSSTTTRHKSSI